MAYYAGTLSITILATILTLSLPPASETSEWSEWLEIFASFPSFRFIFMIILLLALTAFDIRILRGFKINYLFIFELDPHYKLTHIQIYRVSSIVFNLPLALYVTAHNSCILLHVLSDDSKT